MIMSRQSAVRSDNRKVSAELFVLTHGALVAQLVKDYESDEEVNKQLDKINFRVTADKPQNRDEGPYIIIGRNDFGLSKSTNGGYNIGVRLVEDFLARSNVGRCHDFRETADVIAKLGFKMFLGISPVITNWSAASDEFSLILDNNPLAEFAELPEGHEGLLFSNILCGVLRGALEMVQMEVDVWFVQDSLRGDDTTEIRLKFIRKLEDALPAGED